MTELAVFLYMAVEEVAWGKYILVADKNVFEGIPYRIRFGKILKEIRVITGCRLSIGLGTSDLMWEARENHISDRPWQKIAEETSHSINTILKFHAIVEKYRSNVLTVNVLSLIYGCSLRSMYQMVEKLGQWCGYIEEEGKQMVNDAGRLSQLLKIGICI